MLLRRNLPLPISGVISFWEKVWGRPETLYFISYPVPFILGLFYFIVLFPYGKLLEFILINFIVIVLSILLYILFKLMIKNFPLFRVFIREILWVIISVLALTSFFSITDPEKLSTSNVLGLLGPSITLGASLILLSTSHETLRKMKICGRNCLSKSELDFLLNELREKFKDKRNELEEIEWAYKNTILIPYLFSLGQLNVTLIIISNIFEKLIGGSFNLLNLSIPEDCQRSTLKKAKYLGLNLRLDEEDFDFRKFWRGRGKYVHNAISKKVNIVPSEEYILKSIRLLSKTLREYPKILQRLEIKHH